MIVKLNKFYFSNALLTPSISITSVVFLRPAVSDIIIGYPDIFIAFSIISLVVPSIGDTIDIGFLPILMVIINYYCIE